MFKGEIDKLIVKSGVVCNLILVAFALLLNYLELESAKEIIRHQYELGVEIDTRGVNGSSKPILFAFLVLNMCIHTIRLVANKLVQK